MALQAQKAQRPRMAAAAGTASKWRWVFSGGGPLEPARVPPGISDLYFTGHEDGRVRVWDVTAKVPGLLATVPFDSGGPGVRLRPVSCLQVPVATFALKPSWLSSMRVALHGQVLVTILPAHLSHAVASSLLLHMGTR